MDIKSARQLFHAKEYARSIDIYQGLIQLEPTNPTLYLELSSALLSLGQVDEALVVAKQGAHHASPDFEVYCDNQIAQIYLLQKRYDFAEEKFHQLIRMYPEFLEAYIGLSSLYLRTGYASKALSMLEHCKPIGKDQQRWVHNYSQALFESRNANRAIQQIGLFEERYGNDQMLSINALMFSSYTDEIDAQISKSMINSLVRSYEANPIPSCAHKAAPGKNILKLGFVSSDFCFHPVGQFFSSFVADLRSLGVKTFLFSNGHIEDEWTKKLQMTSDSFSSIRDLGAEAASQVIGKAELDVLIDLSGPTSGNRFDVFALRPCKVQATYLGFPDSCHMPFIDYVLTDLHHVPNAARELYSEKVVYIDDLRFCFLKPTHCPPISLAPVCLNEYLTFGSFANPAKISDRCLNFWARALMEVPNSRFRLQHKQWVDLELQNGILQVMAKHGVAPGRIEFHGSAKYDAYMDAYRKIDVILDTLPFTGGTTTCEALWAGVPVVTIEGQTASSRQSAAILRSIGFEQFVAEGVDQGLAIVKSIATKTSILEQFKNEAHGKILKSALGDPAKFAKSFKAAIEELLSDSCGT